jgi:serine/threonine-protein kinase
VESFAGYEIVEALETGGSQEHFRVKTKDGAKAVLKVFRRKGRSGEERLRLARDLEALAEIQHARILGLLASGIEEGDHWYLVPEAEGPTLQREIDHRLIQMKQQFSVAEVLQITIGLGEALGYLHENGMVHAGLDPSQIHLMPVIGVVLKEVVPVSTGSLPEREGSSESRYASPEQIQGDEVTPASDVYQVGLLLYHLLTGKLPLEDENSFQTVLRRMQEEMPPPSRIRQEVSEEVDHIILKCLRPQLKDRYPDLNAFLEEVLRLDPQSGELLPGEDAVGEARDEADSLMGLLLPAEPPEKAILEVSLMSTILPGAVAGLLVLLVVLYFLFSGS